MSATETGIRRVAIIGCGVIGSSWAAHYLARGLEVVATDPAPGAERRLRDLVDGYWPALVRIGLATEESRDRLRLERDIAKAVAGADFVQENGPERVDIKRDLVAQIDAALDDDALIATSSSGILISDVQSAARHPERVLLGHPFNPPHLIPLVEVVGGKLTSPEAINRALRFYSAVGKKPIHIRREVKGHRAYRLQAALWREAFYLVHQGVATVADIDTAIAQDPGLRWALLGPFLNLHLSGSEAGIAHVIEHLGPPLESLWQDLSDLPAFSEGVKAQAVEGVEAELLGYSLRTLIEQRDDVLLALLALKARANQLP